MKDTRLPLRRRQTPRSIWLPRRLFYRAGGSPRRPSEGGRRDFAERLTGRQTGRGVDVQRRAGGTLTRRAFRGTCVQGAPPGESASVGACRLASPPASGRVAWGARQRRGVSLGEPASVGTCRLGARRRQGLIAWGVRRRQGRFRRRVCRVMTLAASGRLSYPGARSAWAFRGRGALGVARGRRMMKRREKMLKKGRKGAAGRWAELRGAYNIRAK